MDVLAIIDKRIENRIQEVESNKDLFVFNALSNSSFNEKMGGIDDLYSSMDKICYAAFVDENYDVADLVKRTQGQKPIGGMHYSSNPIELIAMAKLDYQFEESRLKKYMATCSLKEQFIINQFFSDIDYTPKQAQDSIEKVISNTILNDSPTTSLEDVIEGVGASNDLLDLYILKTAYKRVYSLHSDRELEKDLDSFIDFHNNLRDYQKTKFKILYGFLVLLIAVGIICAVIAIYRAYWDTIEPIDAAIGFLSLLIMGVVSIFFRKKMLRLIDVYDSVVDWSVDNWYYNKSKTFKKNLDEIVSRRGK